MERWMDAMGVDMAVHVSNADAQSIELSTH